MPPYSAAQKARFQKRAPVAPTPIERPSYKPSSYQAAIIDRLLTGTGNALVDAKAGCLAGDTMIGVNRAGKSSQMTLEYLVHMFNSGTSVTRTWDKTIPTRVRSKVGGTIQLQEIHAAYFSGMKETYTLRTEAREIRATADHRFLTINGWQKLSDLKVGSILVVDGGKGVWGKQDKPYYRNVYGMEHHPYCTKTTTNELVQYRVPEHRLVAEAAANGLGYETFRVNVRDGKTDGYVFFDPKTHHVHHVDHDHTNNDDTNLTPLTVLEHKSHHSQDNWRNVQAQAVFDIVTDITYAGTEPTYDITMKDETNPNFVANGIVVHNSGKTSTLCMLSDCIPNTPAVRAAFIAFNRPIADELKRRLPAHVTAATWHSICRLALLRMPQFARFANDRNWVQGSKFHTLFDMIVGTFLDGESYRAGVRQLVGLMKANALLPDASDADITTLVEHFEIEFSEHAANGGLEQGVTMARQVLTLNNNMLDRIDFDDMLYFAYIMGAPLTQYTHVFIDEAQDTNKIQRLLLARMLGPQSRLVAVGDPSQSIYGFRGADSEAMNAIRDEFLCTTFPLSISYRCPASVIRLAQTIEPNIEARPNAPEGTVTYADMWELADFSSTDLVLCRNTAPIVSLGFKMLRAHKPVRILGREIGEQLVGTIQKMRSSTLEDLADKLEEYTSREVAKAIKKRQENKAEQLSDQRDAVLAIIDGMPENARTVFEVIRVIRQLFADEGLANQTTLSTIHKSKGGEANRVFILDAHLMPSKYAKQYWQQQQERNIQYVAYTRSLDTLVFVRSEGIKW